MNSINLNLFKVSVGEIIVFVVVSVVYSRIGLGFGVVFRGYRIVCWVFIFFIEVIVFKC